MNLSRSCCASNVVARGLHGVPNAKEAPTEWFQRSLARLVVLTDDQKFLARSPIVAAGKVVEPVISQIEAVDDREHRATGLYDTPAHSSKMVTTHLALKLRQRAGNANSNPILRRE
jgi:hypothetical protein